MSLLTSRRRLVLVIGAVPVALTAVLALYRPPLFVRLDTAAYDVVTRAAGTRPPDSRVAIVDVDERSLASVGQWPWRRDVMGRLIAALRAGGVSVIAVDVIFAEPDRRDRGDAAPAESPDAPSDLALAAVLHDNVAVLGYGLSFDRGAPAGRACVLHPLPLTVLRPPAEESVDPFFHANGAVCDIPVLGAAAARSGFLNAAPDSDGVLRRAPLVAELAGRLYPSLALSAYAAATHAGQPTLRVATVDAATLTIADLEVPLDGKSNLLLGFRGKKRSFPYFSAVDVLNGAVGPESLHGKIVVVGTTALGTREVVATPLDTQFVGAEVQATAIDNLLQRDFVRRSMFAPSLDLLIVLLAAGLVAAIAGFWGVTAGLLATGVLLAGAWWGSIRLLTVGRLFVSPLPPTVGVAAALAVMTLARFTVERGRAARASHEKHAAQGLMVQALLSLTEVRDAETGRHSLRTQQYARLLAQSLAGHPRFREFLTAERVDLLSRLAPLHDIGKVGVPDRILNKPGALTPDETVEMRRHPELGLAVIVRAESRVGVRDDATLQMAKDIVYTHHERWDGTGYPRGLRGTDIPVPGRIMAVVDVYDAVHARALYRAPLPHDETVQLIVRGRESHFDPDVVDAFLRVSHDFEVISGSDQPS